MIRIDNQERYNKINTQVKSKINLLIRQIFLKQSMKSQLNQYYQCSSNGYVKHQNVAVKHLPTIKELPISSKCNQILPYQLHKLQVKQPIVMNTPKQLQIQTNNKVVQVPSKEPKKQNSLNYSFSTSLMQNPNKILQKDQVHSIHLEDHRNGIKNNKQIEVDLSKSNYTVIRRVNPQMIRSVYSTKDSQLTYYTNPKKQNQKLQIIAHQLKKQKQKRQQFQKKYQILLNLINKIQNKSTISQNVKQEKSVYNDKLIYSTRNKNFKHKFQFNSDAQCQDNREQSRSIKVDYTQNKRKASSPSPIIINIGSQLLQKTPKNNNQKVPTEEQQTEHLIQIKEGLSQIKQQVNLLHQNFGYLEKKIDQQEVRHQKQILLQELKEKQRKIQQVVKQNQKIKEINEILFNRKIQIQSQEKQVVDIKIQKNTLTVSFIVSLLLILLILNFRSAIC